MLLLAFLACTRSDTDEEADSDSDVTPFVPDVAPGGCDAPAYDWAPLAEMGTIVDWEVADEATLSAQSIDLLLAAAGIEGFSPVPYGARVYRVRYITQDRGQDIEATALLSWPDAAGDFPTILWVHPTTGFTDQCAPSAGPLEYMAASFLLASQGFAVAAPDYLGMNGWGEPAPFLHPYVVPEPTAVASLDSVRALVEFQQTAVDPTLAARGTYDTVIWGASEGGAASLWSDRYAEHYLPEINVLGTISMAAPTDLRGLGLHAVAHWDATGEGLLGVMATSRLWYGGTVPLTDLVKDEEPYFIASRVEGALAASCDPGDVVDGVRDASEVFTPEALAAVSEERWDDLQPWTCMLDKGTLQESTFPRVHDAPVLFTIGEADDLIDADLEVADAPRLCGLGYDMEIVRCAGAGHVDGIAQAMPHALRWAQDRVAGEPVGTQCVVPEPIDCRDLQ